MLACLLGRRRYGLWAPTRWLCRCGHRGCLYHSCSVVVGSQAPGWPPGKASSGYLGGSGGLYEDGPGLRMEMVEATLFRFHNPFRSSLPIQHTYTQNHTHSAWYSQRCLCSWKPVINSLLYVQVSCSHPAHLHTIHGSSFHRTPPLGLEAMLLDIQMALMVPGLELPTSV